MPRGRPVRGVGLHQCRRGARTRYGDPRRAGPRSLIGADLKRLAASRGPPAVSRHSVTAHYANEPSLSDQAPPMQRATINRLSSETALPNRRRIAECRRKSQNIVALARFASGRAPAVREPAAFIFCLPIPPVCLLVFLLVSAAIGDENDFKFN